MHFLQAESLPEGRKPSPGDLLVAVCAPGRDGAMAGKARMGTVKSPRACIGVGIVTLVAV
jgi:hypothetical protein